MTFALHFLSFRFVFCPCNFTFSALSKLCNAPIMIGMLPQIVSLCIFAFRIKILNGNPCAGLVIHTSEGLPGVWGNKGNIGKISKGTREHEPIFREQGNKTLQIR